MLFGRVPRKKQSNSLPTDLSPFIIWLRLEFVNMVRKIMSDVEARFILDQYVRQLPALFVVNSFCE